MDCALCPRGLSLAVDFISSLSDRLADSNRSIKLSAPDFVFSRLASRLNLVDRYRKQQSFNRMDSTTVC
eukprot:m.276478 g.276478  ORF g.276478 m.276478 type:complete len:69 (-) comp15713_c0_seq21:759-965(-)